MTVRRPLVIRLTLRAHRRRRRGQNGLIPSAGGLYDELAPGGLFDDMTLGDINRNVADWRKKQDVMGYYESLAGEAEARLVQNRMGLTAAQRYAESIKYGSKYGFDVPESDQIVRFDGA